ncbi:MAG: cysteine desulfurase [Firmicutes bacterium]|nr:cysteine desulfurase [Bacillota bacterium]
MKDADIHHAFDGGGKRIYFDHCATTPMYEEVKDLLGSWLRSDFKNPSGLYKTSRILRRSLDDAREELAKEFFCRDTDIIFTSGGTESDNAAIYGLSGSRESSVGEGLSPVIVSSIEHEAILRPAQFLGASVVNTHPNGSLDLDHLEDLLKLRKSADTVLKLVSIMAVNNETGVIQPLSEAADLVRSYFPDAFIHSDCVQAFSSRDIAETAALADALSFSAHKFGGPIGVGALVLKKQARKSFIPFMRGGQQERGYRAGTENLPAILGMAKAASLCATGKETELKNLTLLAERLLTGLKSIDSNISVVGRDSAKVAHIMLLHIPDIRGEELCYLLDVEGIEVSTGSACAAGAREPSHVLLSMGWGTKEAKEVIRVSFGRTNTEAEVDEFLRKLQKAVRALRA